MSGDDHESYQTTGDPTSRAVPKDARSSAYVVPDTKPLSPVTADGASRGSKDAGVDSQGNVQPVASADSSNLTLPPIEPVSVQIRNLSVEVDISPAPLEALLSKFSRRGTGSEINAQDNTKLILKDVCADIPPGSLTAIIGGSGSGKTSLLNAIAEKLIDDKVKVGGLTTFNGKKGLGAARCAYVMQQDILLPMLSVRETLECAASLRLAGITRQERREAVEAVILELGVCVLSISVFLKSSDLNYLLPISGYGKPLIYL